MYLGKVLDRDYRVTAESRGLPVDKARGDDLHTFPIEVARLRTVFWYVFLAVFVSIGYGWALETDVEDPILRDPATQEAVRGSDGDF